MSTTTISLPEHTTPRVRGRDGRRIETEFDLGVDEHGTHHYAVLYCSLDNGGLNYFNGRRTNKAYYAAVRHETSQGDGLRGWTLGDGIEFARSEPVTRFNRKRLQEFFDAQLDGLESFLAEHPKVAAYFEQRGERA